MYCYFCGTSLPEQGRFCPECGQPVAVAKGPQNRAATVDHGEQSRSSGATQRSSPQADAPLPIPTPPAESGHTDHDARPDVTLGQIAAAERAIAVSRSGTLARVFGALGLAFALHVIAADRPLSVLFPVPVSVPRQLLTESVVGILCESTVTGEISQGSGTVMASDGMVLTNAHVIPQDGTWLHVGDEGCAVTFPEAGTGQIKDMYRAQPIVIPGASEEYDLAYLQITGPFLDATNKPQGQYPRTFPSLWDSDTYLAVCSGSVPAGLGDTVRIFGYPASGQLNLAITEGVVSSVMAGGRLLTSAKLDSGNSGGLAVNSRGCFVGVPSAVVEGNFENLGVIIPQEHLGQFSELVKAHLGKANP